jgi:uncharacterized protein (DUF58 family)
MRRRVDGEAWAAALGLGLAGIGWSVHATLLALAGTLGAMTALTLWVWQRQCLTGVTYRRTLRQHRATFGEEVLLDIELVNDKVLPLTWLHVEDDVSRGLTIRGGNVVFDRSGPHQELHHLLPMLPFQRVRRTLTVVCDQRGEHTFGPARIRSGDPVGLHQRFATVREEERLLVYPKLFGLGALPVASQVPLGDERAAANLMGDPSRTAGVREYRAGDPLRHIDWRATARGGSLLVRVFEPTAALRVAVFLDMRTPRHGPAGNGLDVMEFTVAVGASVVADLSGRGVATGLYCSGSVQGRTVVREPSSSPAALAAMLELLARASPYGPSSIAELLAGEGPRLRRGASVLVVAGDFAPTTLVALAALRRRLPVTAVWVATEQGRPPPAELVDIRREVRYFDGWKHGDVVDLLG